jgi:Ni,Fe-hydrogenase maturation factor
MNKSNMFGTCSCKLYESYDIPCRHVIQVLRAEKQIEIPSIYIWPMEKQCSDIYTHEVFRKFQEQVVVARDHCIIQMISESEDTKIVTISSQSGKERVVQMNKSNMFGTCSCKLYESYDIPCRHVIQVLRAEKQIEIPSIYITKRWEKRCKR